MTSKRAVGIGIIKRKPCLQMRSGWRKPAGKHQVSTGGGVTQNEPAGIVALTAQTQQVFVQAQRQIQFAAEHVMERLPKGNVNELRGGIQLLPQLSCASIGTPRFRRCSSLEGQQGRAQAAEKFELLSLALRGVRK